MTENEFTWPARDPSKGTWFGSEELKAWVLARMIKHREDDELIRGVYQEPDPDTPGGYRGCLIGCTLPKYVRGGSFGRVGYLIPGVGHVLTGGGPERDVEALYGIRYKVACLLESTFEDADTFEEAAEFAVASIEAIPVGVRYPDPDDFAILDSGDVLAFLRTEGVPA